MIDIPVLYADLDGTVRQGKDELGRFVNGPDDVVVFPEAVEMMYRWKQAGGLIAAVSNQGGVALGIMPAEDMWAAVNETRTQCQGLIDAVHVCVHHPKADDPADARCWCRKPSAGAIAEAAHALAIRQGAMPGEKFPAHLAVMVGDRPEDRQAAEAAGVDFVPAEEWRARAGEPVPNPVGWPPPDDL